MNVILKILNYNFFLLPLLSATLLSLLINTPVAAIQKDAVRLKAILCQDPDQRALSYPTTLFFDTDTEDIYVTDTGNSQLVLFDNEGYPTDNVGKGRGLYNIISAMCHEGKLYVCCGSSGDFASGYINILNNAFFSEQRLILAQKVPNRKTLITRRVMSGLNGAFYVLQNNSSEICVFDKDWNFLHHILPRYKRLGVLDPAIIVDMAQDQHGTMYFLSEQKGRVFVYDYNEKFLFSFGEKGGDKGKMARPQGIAVDSHNNRIYISDYLRHTVLVYTIEGQWLYEIGSKGNRPGYFFYPSDVCTDNNGILYVADTFNHRVQIFSVIPGRLPDLTNRSEEKTD